MSTGGAHGIVERIFVDPDHHRKGVGSEAMKLIMGRYPDVTFWTLGSPEWNTRAPLFLESLGFEQVGWEHSDPKVKARWYEKRTGDAQGDHADRFIEREHE